MIRLLVVDDHPIVRQGLVGVLEDDPEFTVVGSVPSAETALAQLASAAPDVILLDLELGGGMDGVAAIGPLLAAQPAARILVFTAYDTSERVFAAIQAGAKGYLLKGAPVEELTRAIRTVYADGSYLESRVASTLLAEVRTPRRGGGRLSERERAVLRLVAAGLTSKQIARELAITERTVQFHVTGLLNKLGAESRAQAVAIAAERGLL
ncbi:MAG: response regulator transcription factor [Thermomicrobiales bacterium]